MELIAITQALAMMGDISLIIIAPAVVINTIKIIKIESAIQSHVEADRVAFEMIQNRLNAHGKDIVRLKVKGGVT